MGCARRRVAANRGNDGRQTIQTRGLEHGQAQSGNGNALRASPRRCMIAKRLEEDIVLGRRQPKERLIEQDLSDLFQTHRGDVRLALFELEKKGLVERIPNRGALVRGLTPLEVTEIYAVREELEVMAVRIIPFPVGNKDIERLEELQRQHAAAIAAGDLLSVFYSNLSFHQALVRPVRQCLPDRDHRSVGAEGLRHPLLRERISGITRRAPAATIST